MPYHANLQIAAGVPVQLSQGGDVAAALTLFNRGLTGVELLVRADTATPVVADFANGFPLLPLKGLQGTLADISPGIPGGIRIWALADQPTTVHVSYA